MYDRCRCGHEIGLFLHPTTKCDRQSVGHIRRIRGFLQAKYLLNRALDLSLSRMSVADDGLFDPIGRELFDDDASPTGRQQDHAARVAHENRRARMGIMRIKLLHRANIRLEFFEQFHQSRIQFHQSIRNRRLGIEPNHAAVDEPRRRFKIDYSVTRDLQAGIDAENAHGNQTADFDS